MLILAMMSGSFNAYAQIDTAGPEFNVDDYELVEESCKEGVTYHSREETLYRFEDYIVNNLLSGNLLEAIQTTISEAEKEIVEMKGQGYETK